MTGTIVQKDGIWVVKYDRGHEVLFYRLNPESNEWTKKNAVKRFLKEGIEVDFSLITTGEYSEEKESLVKEFSAKILYVNHHTI